MSHDCTTRTDFPFYDCDWVSVHCTIKVVATCVHTAAIVALVPGIACVTQSKDYIIQSKDCVTQRKDCVTQSKDCVI